MSKLSLSSSVFLENTGDGLYPESLLVTLPGRLLVPSVSETGWDWWDQQSFQWPNWCLHRQEREGQGRPRRRANSDPLTTSFQNLDSKPNLWQCRKNHRIFFSGKYDVNMFFFNDLLYPSISKFLLLKHVLFIHWTNVLSSPNTSFSASTTSRG